MYECTSVLYQISLGLYYYRFILCQKYRYCCKKKYDVGEREYFPSKFQYGYYHIYIPYITEDTVSKLCGCLSGSLRYINHSKLMIFILVIQNKNHIHKLLNRMRTKEAIAHAQGKKWLRGWSD